MWNRSSPCRSQNDGTGSFVSRRIVSSARDPSKRGPVTRRRGGRRLIVRITTVRILTCQGLPPKRTHGVSIRAIVYV